MRRTLENCETIRLGVKLGHGKPEQRNGKCLGYQDADRRPMPICGWCKVFIGAKESKDTKN